MELINKKNLPLERLITGSCTLEETPGVMTRLTHDYRAGDLVVFNAFLVHGGLDNQTNRIRISSDSRYQLAGEPVDERWIGENPVAHGPGGKREKIC